MKLFEPIKIGGKTALNRIMMPPCVVIGTGTVNGTIGEFRMRHYEQRAKDGVGIIVIEAAAVQEEYGRFPCQIGIWSDKHIPEMKELADRIHQYPSLCTVQLYHAGGQTMIPYNNVIRFGPSAGDYDGGVMREATVHELEGVCESFITAAIRIREAGFDGVEIHNAHGTLLTQMVSPLLNKRTDVYGGELENRMKLSLDILKGIRKACGSGFIIGVRMGANEPTYENGIQIARMLEENGADYISVSGGYGDMSKLPPPPADFPYNAIVYGGTLVKKETRGIPVILSNDIKTATRGEWLLQNGFGDMIAYGRPLLATPDFVSRAKESPGDCNDCIGCSHCIWLSDYTKCPTTKNK